MPTIDERFECIHDREYCRKHLPQIEHCLEMLVDGTTGELSDVAKDTLRRVKNLHDKIGRSENQSRLRPFWAVGQ